MVTSTTNKDLPIIKKAKGPFIQFSEEKRLEIINSNPGIRLSEVSKIAGRMWKSLSEEEKKVYQEKFEKEKEELKKEQEVILKSLTPEQKQQIEDEKQERRKKRKDRKLKALRKSLGRPRPVGTNPFLLYVKSQMLDRGEANMQMYIQGASDFWKKMPEEDKQPYVDEARMNSRKYREELAKWEGRMLLEGHENLLSKSKLSFLKRTKRTAVRKPAVKSLKSSAVKTSTSKTSEHKEPTRTKTTGTQTLKDKKPPKGNATTTEKKK